MPGHLIHVGFPKTGSTALRAWFRAHPELAYADGGIAGFGSVYDIARVKADAPPEIRFRVTSSESLTAPRTDATGDDVDPAPGQQSVCSSLAELFPNASVLIVTRGFRSMILSSYSQYVRTGATVSFEQFLRHPFIGRPWEYDRVIGMYRTAFGAANVLVLPWELLRDDPDRFVAAIEARLGLSHVAMARVRLNRSLSPVELHWYPRLSRVVARLPLTTALKRFYLRGVFANGFRRPIGILQRVRPRQPVSDAAIPDALLAAYRLNARTLREEPLYAAYAAEYYGAERA